MRCHSYSTRQCHSRISSCFQFTSKILGPALWLFGRTANKHHLQHTLGRGTDNLRGICVSWHHDWRVSREFLFEDWSTSSADTCKEQCVIQPSLAHCFRQVCKALQQMDPVPLYISVPLHKRPWQLSCQSAADISEPWKAVGSGWSTSVLTKHGNNHEQDDSQAWSSPILLPWCGNKGKQCKELCTSQIAHTHHPRGPWWECRILKAQVLPCWDLQERPDRKSVV